MSETLQRRYSPRPLQVTLRDNGAGVPTITGYAAVFYDPADPGTRYQLWEGCEERIMPGAFDRAMKEDDPLALFNHDAGRVLGRMSSRTLRLSVDARGLRYDIDPPDTPTAKEVIELLRRGDVRGSSFAFVPRESTYRDAPDLFVIERNDVKLFDVGPVTYPAYEGTEAGVRAAGDLDAIRREIDRHRARRHFDALQIDLALMEMEDSE